LENSPKYNWIAEYHNNCAEKLVENVLGASDSMMKTIEQLIQSNPSFAAAIRKRHFDEENPLNLENWRHEHLLASFLLGYKIVTCI
jgi:hypothetical protein